VHATCNPLPEIYRRLSDNVRVAMFLFLALRNDLPSCSQRRNCTFSCTAAPLTRARMATISSFYSGTAKNSGLTRCDAASFGVSLRFERKYCLHLQGLMGPRRLTVIKTPRNNNNPATTRHIPEDMNAQVNPYPVRPWLMQLNRRHLNLFSQLRTVGLVCLGVSAQQR
jgi:hypothetical protein